MALPEEERRRFERLEQELASTDPDLVRKLQTGTPGQHPREAAIVVRGVLTLVAGFTLVVVGTATEVIIIGVAGFLLMMAGGHWFINGLGLYLGPKETKRET
ncbi:DUF3040 domain-containing protein [Pseudarthrobacter sp. NamE2]|uniref:DUF3040 domain-containing protein n=1 Tax=Pseudarthrobacter sp. NamE2 TaxID=2576838 RepID=UPI0010FDCFF5|nr:DUF3040 domain-containing protein [Pseudarthrobacter sp. NamE2]TLM82980.1 DUF3040 domain-containing protein [Pseudarthrobacter sp. NamE2]